jgi:hypothetical protein
MLSAAKEPTGKPPKKLKDPMAIACDGDVYLLVEREDLIAKNWNGWAQTHDLTDRIGPLSACQWLQIWFKWGVYEDCADQDYRDALKELADK